MENDQRFSTVLHFVGRIRDYVQSLFMYLVYFAVNLILCSMRSFVALLEPSFSSRG